MNTMNYSFVQNNLLKGNKDSYNIKFRNSNSSDWIFQ